jgi:hypothetical protein
VVGKAFVPLHRELAAGLREGDGGRHLITIMAHAGPYVFFGSAVSDPYSAGVLASPQPPVLSASLHGEPWLDFDSTQTGLRVEPIRPFITELYKLKPPKPVLMAEGAYEGSWTYGPSRFTVTPVWVRRQAYYSYLAGGHHTYGWAESRPFFYPTLNQTLNAPGAVQLGILKKVFLDRSEWWLLVPDPSILASGGHTPLRLLNLAARHEDGRWAMVYLAEKASFSVNMNKLSAAKVNASWIDPRSGVSTPLGEFSNAGVKSFSTPDGWEDALLVLEAAAK